MSNKDRFFEALQNAIARGFTLAAVSVAVSCGTPSLPGSDAGNGGGGGQTMMGTRDVDGGTLAEVPAGSFFCMGDAGTTGPYYGSCCFNLLVLLQPALLPANDRHLLGDGVSSQWKSAYASVATWLRDVPLRFGDRGPVCTARRRQHRVLLRRRQHRVPRPAAA